MNTFFSSLASLPLFKNLAVLGGARLNRASCIIALEFLTLLYLGLPVLMWLLGWLHLYYALPLALSLIIAALISWKETRRHCLSPDFVSSESGLPLWSFASALVLALVWGIYSGAGGFTHTSPDWPKHYAILRDLTEGAWPVSYTIDNSSNSLVFYLAYYLPAAGVAKVFGWWFGCLTLSIWTCFGTMLAISWFVLLAGRFPVVAAFLFIFANGLDFLGERIVQGGPLPSGTEHIDWWAGLFNLPGHYSQLVWAPQHSLAAWTVTGLLAVQLTSRRSISHALFLVALASFWSPFSIIGFIPLGIVAWIRSGNRGICSFANLLALALLAFSTLFYLSRNYPSPHGFVWELADLREEWPRFLLAHMLEWIIFFIFARELRRSDNPALRPFFWTAGACLLIYPFYSYGYANDWVMRTTIPAMFLLWTGVIRSLLNHKPDLEARIVLLLFIGGTFGSLHESSKTWHLPSTELVEQKVHCHVPELDEPYRSQYIGREDSFFFRYLSRASRPILMDVPPTNP